MAGLQQIWIINALDNSYNHVCALQDIYVSSYRHPMREYGAILPIDIQLYKSKS